MCHVDKDGMAVGKRVKGEGKIMVYVQYDLFSATKKKD